LNQFDELAEKPQRVILFGAGGQLGQQVSASRPEDVELHAYTHAEADICDQQQLQNLFEELQPSCIINTAAYTQVDAAEQHPEMAFAVNADAPGLIAATCPEACRIIHISTDFVFDGLKQQAYSPEDEGRPVNVYGLSKLQGEENILLRRPDSLILRTAWLYSGEGKNFLTTMLRLMSEKESLDVVDDQRGTPTSVNSLAHVIWRFVAKHDLQGIYHWTDQGEASWFEFACEIQRQALALGLLEKQIPVHPVTTDEYPTPAKRPANSVLDKEETCKIIQYKGNVWQQELESVLQALQNC
tara:strand:+ start:301338 stop:302234 length:897 start_codon:yes stop_codon:yes gene_type:complete